MKIIMHNNIIDRDVDVERHFSRYANTSSKRRRGFILDNLRMLFTVSANTLIKN